MKNTLSPLNFSDPMNPDKKRTKERGETGQYRGEKRRGKEEKKDEHKKGNKKDK